MTTRRDLLIASGAALAAIGLPHRAAAAARPRWPSGEVVPLWPGAIPSAAAKPPKRRIQDKNGDPAHPFRLLSGIAAPGFEVHRAPQPDGSAMLVMPGGGYQILAYDNEGLAQAAWLNARGTTVFILFYRLPSEGWRDRGRVPLQDAQRAMRLIRANAGRYGIDPDRVGVLGFSAGGHLAGSLATRHAEATYTPVDAADQLSARPDLAALLYPVVSLVPPYSHAGSAQRLLGLDASPEALVAASVERNVSPATPPLFIAQTNDDDAVDPHNALLLYDAALRARVPVELHLFPTGGHGFGTQLPPETPAAAWPLLMTRTALARGLFRDRKA